MAMAEIIINCNELYLIKLYPVNDTRYKQITDENYDSDTPLPPIVHSKLNKILLLLHICHKLTILSDKIYYKKYFSSY